MTSNKTTEKGLDFPNVMAITICGKKIELPKDAYILYIETMFSHNEKRILLKWQNSADLDDDEYRFLIKNALRSEAENIETESNEQGFDGVLAHYGIKARYSNESVDFKVHDNTSARLKSNVYDSILINILRPFYSNILDPLFPNHNIYLGPEASEGDERLQSLNSSLRVALFFTLIAFLYGGNSYDYESFEEFFSNEYEKRSRLIKNIWFTSESDQKISYLPIFDSFKNYKGSDAEFIIRVIRRLLESDDIVLNDKNEIENKLITQALATSVNSNLDTGEIRDKILKPLVSYSVNINKAEQFLKTAKENFQDKQYDSSINRSYYSMMRALRALLNNYGILEGWRQNTINPDETHPKLEKKLVEEIILKRKLMDVNYHVDFKYVKQQRMLADYNELYLDSHICKQCIEKAERFLSKVKNLLQTANNSLS